jgi:hypothetical protein
VPRIGVKLPAGITRFGEFLADITALEAAGADSIWLDAGSNPSPVQLIQVGAILAATHRVGVGLITSSASTTYGGAALATIQSLSSGRALTALRSGSDLLVADEPWVEIEVGKDRGAWRQVLESHASAGTAGLIVAWDPRIIDLLRNSAGEDDRGDLLISTG